MRRCPASASIQCVNIGTASPYGPCHLAPPGGNICSGGLTVQLCYRLQQFCDRRAAPGSARNTGWRHRTHVCRYGAKGRLQHTW